MGGYRLSFARRMPRGPPKPEGRGPVSGRPVRDGASTRIVATGVSVDLWYTLLWFRPDDRARWRAERARVIAEALGAARGRTTSVRTVERLVRAEVRQLLAERSKLSRLDPSELLRRLARRAGAPSPEATAAHAEALSEAGLRERPPRVNPDARRFLAGLRRRGIPVIVLTNSARRSSTWDAFLRHEGLSPSAGVLTSSELGIGKPDPRAFRAAARRLGIAPGRLAHIGDCWHADVEGARRAGALPVWYRGLFARYPDAGQAEFERTADDRDRSVVRVAKFPAVRRPGGGSE